ncbi:MAG: MBL fold metallo-hydrolase [Gudongella sp.]|nr:MBL fold metallo-hydrolase [Gudongella sp.]
MKIKVLTDNNTIIDRYYLGEPGLSFIVEVNEKKILFDMGYSDVFIRNAFKMGETLRDIDKVVFSHGHMDHTWGLDPYIRLMSEWETEKIIYKKPSLVAHKELFLNRRFEGFNEIGSLVSEDKASRHFDMNLTNKSVKLAEGLWFLGEIERKYDFEGKMAIGEVLRNGAWKPDLVTDDTAMAYEADGGIVVITGCSHSGICNIIEQAKKVTGIEKIVGVIGGFHLMDGESMQVVETGKYFERNGIEEVYACHCTCLAAKIKLSKYTRIKEIGSGMTINKW